MSKNKFCDSSLLDKAIVFASNAHKNTERKGKGFPYIAHPLEAMAIVATMTNDQELLAAACLHDVIEDTDVTYEDLKREFGKRVADVVQAESDVVVPNMSEGDSWVIRKQAQMDHLASASREVQMVAMGDKLSNMRALFRDYKEVGEELWSRFHVTDPKLHEWHYRGLANALSKLNDTEAYQEFLFLLDNTFGKKYGEFEINKKNGKIEVYGEITYENALKLKDFMDKETVNVLDLTAAYSINFSGIRGLVLLNEQGYQFNIINANSKVRHRFEATGFTSLINVTNYPREYRADKLVPAGDGYTSETFFTLDGDAMVKLYYDKIPYEELLNEKRYSLEAFKMGIPTPLSGNIVDVDGRKGIIFERIKDKISIASAYAKDPSRISELARAFADMSKELHTKKCEANIIPSAKVIYKGYVDRFSGLTNEEKERIKSFIDDVEETHTCLHGDFHFGNAIITKDNEYLFIDLGGFSYGNPLFDLGTMYFVTHNENDKRSEMLFHNSNENLKEFYRYFIRYYFSGIGDEEADTLLRPFAALTVIHFASMANQHDWMLSYVRKNLLERIK